MFTDDPVRDAERHYERLDKQVDERPRCSDCDKPIQQETAFYINGELICESCMEAYRVHVEDYME